MPSPLRARRPLALAASDDPPRKRPPPPDPDEEEEEEEDPWAPVHPDAEDPDAWPPAYEEPDEDDPDAPGPPDDDTWPEEPEPEPEEDGEPSEGGGDDDWGEEHPEEEEEDNEGPAAVPPPHRQEVLLDEDDLDELPEDPGEEDPAEHDAPSRYVSTPEAWLEVIGEGGYAELEPSPPMLLRRGLDELLFRPSPLFAPELAQVELGARLPADVALSVPLILCPPALGELTPALDLAFARACVEEEVGLLVSAERARPLPLAAALLLLLTPGAPPPSDEVLEAARVWVIDLIPGARVTLPQGQGALVPLVDSARALGEAITTLRARGAPAVGVRLRAGALEKDLLSVKEAGVDLVMFEAAGSSALPGLPLREQTTLPLPLAAARAGEVLGGAAPALVVGGGVRLPADVLRCVALGAVAVSISTAATLAAGAWSLRPGAWRTPGRPLIFQEDRGAERIRRMIQVFREELAALCRTSGKAQLAGWGKADLHTSSPEWARALGIAPS